MISRASLSGGCFLLALALLSSPPVRGQYLLLDRGLNTSGGSSTKPYFEAAPGSGFLADHFQVGAQGEVWMIDRLRTWGQARQNIRLLGDQVEKIALFGGLEVRPPTPGEPVCECAHLVAIHTEMLHQGSNGVASRQLQISRAGEAVWQLEFDQLNWSVPGGQEIQFGVKSWPRSSSAANRGVLWASTVVPTATAHHITVFDEKGKLIKPYAPAPADPKLGFAVQVWGHQSVTITIRPQGELWDVRLQGTSSFESTQVDQASLEFGPKRARPVAVRNDGADLVMSFRSDGLGIRPGELTACLAGRRRDGAPFEGCDLVKPAAR